MADPEIEAAKAHIVGGDIIIRLPIENLPIGVDGAWAAGYLSPRMKVTDAAAFAKDLCHALNNESEDGTTAIHRMLDKAVLDAYESGAEGIEEHEDQEGNNHG